MRGRYAVPASFLVAILLLAVTSALAENSPFRQEFGPVQGRGKASVSTPPGGPIVVSGIGSSGQDGIRMDTGGTRGPVAPIRWMAPESLDGRSLTLQGNANDPAGEVITFGSRIYWEDLGGPYAICLPFPSGYPLVTLTVYSNGNPIYTETGQSGVNPMYESSVAPTGGGVGFATIREADAFSRFPVTEWHYPAGTQFQFPGAKATHIGDRVGIRILETPSPIGALNSVDILGTEPAGSTGEMTILEFPAGIFGHAAGNLDGAILAGTGGSSVEPIDALRVINHLTSGRGGLALDPDDDDDGIDFVFGTPPPMTTGSKLFVGGLSWATDDGSGAPLPLSTCTAGDSFFDIFTDIAVNDPPTAIEFHLDGQLVHTQLNPTQAARVFTSVQGPYRVGIKFKPGSAISNKWNFREPVTFQDGNGEDQDCDTVTLIYPPDPILPFYPVDEVFVRASDIPGNEWTVTGVANSVTPPATASWTAATGQGNAGVELTPDGSLVVNNIGSSGEDGVRVEFDPDPDVGASWVRAARPPFRGHVTVLKFAGTASGGGGTGGPIGEFGATGDGVNAVCAADMSPLGPGDLTYNFYENGVLVASTTAGHGVAAFEAGEMPTSAAVSLTHPDGRARLRVRYPDYTICNTTHLATEKAAPASFTMSLVEVIVAAGISSGIDNVDTLEFIGSGGGLLGFTDIGPVNISAVGDLPGSPVGARLHPAAPNPFNPHTMIAFDVVRPGEYALEIFDVRGVLIRRLAGGFLGEGRFERTWDGRDAQGREVSSGTYLVQLRGGGQTDSEKLLLVK